ETCTMESARAQPALDNSSVEIARLTADRAAAWDDYVQRASGATFCHQSGWSRVVERTWGHTSYGLLAQRDGVVAGLLPLFHVHVPLFGSMLVSTPAAIYGGALADDPD